MFTSHGRAAVLCFGGWGLQTMLHLWPRLAFIQEEREALGIAERLPNLNKLTAFAGIVPHPLVPEEPASDLYRPFALVRPNPDRYPEPFFLEAQRAQVEQYNHPLHMPRLTPSERVAASLLEEARNQQYILDIRAHFPPLRHRAEPKSRVSRLEMFGMGIDWAESAARTILRQVVAPTRLDSLQPQDALVRTTLYVVAPLGEPLVTALLWPIVSEMVAALGNRNLVNVIGLFATGALGYTEGDLHVIEEAVTYSALEELEALTGVPGRTQVAGSGAHSYDEVEHRIRIEYALRDLVKHFGKSGWEKRVGKELFNRIFLIDREKSNQSLARDGLELAVLAGNALEAFLVGDAAEHLDTQLGPQSAYHRAVPYSVLGAASDYVPIAEYLLGTVRAEQKRIVRDEVLRDVPDATGATLAELGVGHDDVVEGLLARPDPRLFTVTRTRGRGRRSSGVKRAAISSDSGSKEGASPTLLSLPTLRVAKSFFLKRAAKQGVRSSLPPPAWPEALERYLAQAQEDVHKSLGVGEFAEEWGIHYDAYHVAGVEPEDLLAQTQSKTWAQRHAPDTRVLPAAIRTALEQAVTEISRSPRGLVVAERRVGAWMREAEQVRNQLQRAQEASSAQGEKTLERRVQAWEREYDLIARQPPRVRSAALLALFSGVLAFLAAAGWQLYSGGSPLSAEQLTLSVAVALTTAPVIALAVRLSWTGRLRALQERRLALARDTLSLEADRAFKDALLAFYGCLYGDLAKIHSILGGAVERLEKWADPAVPETLPPSGAPVVHLRQPRTSPEVRQDVQALIREERAEDGSTAQELFRRSWMANGQRLAGWQEVGGTLPQRARLSLELLLNQRELGNTIRALARENGHTALRHEGEAREGTDLSPVTADGEAYWWGEVQRGEWCCFASGAPNQLPDVPHCTACFELGKYGCPFGGSGEGHQAAWGLDLLVREHVQRSTEHLVARRRVMPDRPEETRRLLEAYNIERLLFANGSSGGHRVDVESRRAYLDQLTGRAKVSANYDIANLLSSQPVEIDFMMLFDGPHSGFQQLARETNISLLPSFDPTTISIVRTVNYLALEDLRLLDRCRNEYLRLGQEDRAVLSLSPESLETKMPVAGEERRAKKRGRLLA